jgi:hypothetical protein
MGEPSVWRGCGFGRSTIGVRRTNRCSSVVVLAAGGDLRRKLNFSLIKLYAEAWPPPRPTTRVCRRIAPRMRHRVAPGGIAWTQVMLGLAASTLAVLPAIPTTRMRGKRLHGLAKMEHLDNQRDSEKNRSAIRKLSARNAQIRGLFWFTAEGGRFFQRHKKLRVATLASE